MTTHPLVQPSIEFAAAALVAFAAAVAFFPALALSWSKRSGLFVGLSGLILASPLLVSDDHRLLRLLASIVSVALFAKSFDLHLSASRGWRPDLRTFLAALPNFTTAVLRRFDAEPRPSDGENVARLAGGLAGCAAGSVLLLGSFQFDWRGVPFEIEHAAKVVAFYLALLPGAAALIAAWRLAGGRARDFMQNPLLAHTPADFWRRYNRSAQQFFYEDIFKPAGGLRQPVRAALVTFGVSAVLHEYLFTATLGRVEGYQTAFFLLHGLAVAATLRIRPAGWRVVPWTAATFAFNVASSMLFFASLRDVLPLYSQELPGWLDWWPGGGRENGPGSGYN